MEDSRRRGRKSGSRRKSGKAGVYSTRGEMWDEKDVEGIGQGYGGLSDPSTWQGDFGGGEANVPKTVGVNVFNDGGQKVFESDRRM